MGDEEELVCEGCGSYREVEIYKNLMTERNARDVEMCVVCAATQTGNALALYPRLTDYQTREVLRAIAEVANLILGELDNVKKQLK